MNNFMNNGYVGMGRFPVAPYNQAVMSMYNQQQTIPQQMQQPVQQVMAQQVSMADLPITEIKFLNANQIKGYISTAGTKSLLIDREKGLAHLVGADYSGNTETNIFKFEGYKPEEEKPVVAPVLDDKLYVKKEELQNELDDLFDDLNKKIEKLSKQIRIKELLTEDKPNEKPKKEKEIDHE